MSDDTQPPSTEQPESAKPPDAVPPLASANGHAVDPERRAMAEDIAQGIRELKAESHGVDPYDHITREDVIEVVEGYREVKAASHNVDPERHATGMRIAEHYTRLEERSHGLMPLSGGRNIYTLINLMLWNDAIPVVPLNEQRDFLFVGIAAMRAQYWAIDTITETVEKARKGFPKPNRPDIVILYDTDVRAMIDGKSEIRDHDAAWIESWVTPKLVDESSYLEKLATEADDLERAEIKHRKRLSREADDELNADGWAPPTTDDYGSYAELSQHELPESMMVIDKLAGYDHNISLTAQFKTGKTITGLNCARSLVDGQPFIGCNTTLDPDAGVGWINCEMDSKDLRGYLDPMQILSRDRLHILNVRGIKMPLMVDATATWLTDWLRERGIKVLFIDSWRVLCAWSAIDENDNSGQGRLLARLNAIKHDAGVQTLIMLAHTGREQHEEGNEHARGATTFDDDADARWILTKDVETGTRYLRAEGRQGVHFDSTQLFFDPATNLLSAGRRVTRARAQTDAGVFALCTLLADRERDGLPGPGRRELPTLLDMGGPRVTKIVKMATNKRPDDPDDEPLVRVEEDGQTHRHVLTDAGRMVLDVKNAYSQDQR